MLSLRPTSIGGETAPDDYVVIFDGRHVGRIRRATENSWQGEVWNWHINPPLPIPAWGNGAAASLDAAKADLKAAWERFYASLTDAEIAYWHSIDRK